MFVRSTSSHASRSHRVIGWGSALALAGSLTLGSLPAAAEQSASPACTTVRVALANPSPGDNLLPGNLRIDGTAFDVTAQQGTGISRVALFLDSRESGGTDLGNATLGQPATGPVPSSQFSNAGFTIIAGLPSNNSGPHTIYAYAYTNAGAVQTTSVDIQINGSGSSSSTTTATAPAQQPLCGAGSGAAAASPAAAPSPTPASASAPASSSSSASSATMVLQLENPDPGATVLHGNYQIQGLAYDRAATSGTGVDTVTVFLDSRESGGLDLGTATLGQAGSNSFSLVIGLPSNATGTHSLVVYDHSTATGKESALTVPVTIQ